jgi:hypothetical protein
MLDYIEIIVPTFICWFSIFILAVAQFKGSFKYHFKEIVLSSLILLCSSSYLQINKLDQFSAIINSVLTLLCVVFLFRAKIVSAIIVTAVTYLESAIIEFIAVLLVNKFDLSDSVAYIAGTDSFIGYFIGLVNLLISIFLFRTRFRFTFLSSWKPLKVRKESHIPFFIFSVITLAAMSFSERYLPPHIVAANGILVIVSLIVYLVYVFKQERADDF